LKCPMLSSVNYTVWAIRMKILLKVHKVWEIVEVETTESDKNDMAIALIFQSIPEALILQLGDIETAKKVWDAIKARHLGADRVREARLQTLKSEFDRLKMKETESIDDFVCKLSEISSKSASLGENIDESKLVKKFLSSLPRKKYIHIVASLEQVLDQAMDRYPGAKLLEVELEEKHDVYIYEVELLTVEGVARELHLKADTGELVKDKED